MMSDAVRITRVLPANPSAVFAAWTDPDHLQQWLCPDPGHVAAASCAPVVGGGYRLVMIFPSGSVEISGEYLVVEPPRRLVFTWRPGGDERRESRVTVLLRADGPGTHMTILHERVPDERYRSALTKGWGSVVDRLLHHVTGDRVREARLPPWRGGSGPGTAGSDRSSTR
jgi:uncharacterized protein YndB with AHSA1/START domain